MSDEGELIAGRYRLVSRLGSGAMGVVWQAHDERLRRIVAVKELLLPARLSESEAEEANRRAMREGRITARLHHSHAIVVYDVAEHKGHPCLIMEYLASRSLAAVLSTQGVLLVEDVAGIGGQIASALAAAHQAGIVHRDIKPGNVLLAEDGTAKITDFGVSHAVGDVTVTATGMLAGTPAYLAPEIAQGREASFSSDVFSLGATLYTALEGSPPFGLNPNPIALLHQVASGEIAPPRRSGPLTPVLLRLLARDPDRRPTMRQAQDALATLATSRARGQQDLSVPATPPARSDRPAELVPSLGQTLIQASPPEETITPVRSTGMDAAAAPAPAKGTHHGWTERRKLFVGVVMVMLLAAGVLASMVIPRAHNTGTNATTLGGPSPSPQAPPAPPPASDTPPVTPTDTSSGPAPSPRALPAPPAASGTPPVAPTISPVPGSPQGTPTQLAGAITDYYALVPGNLPAAWDRLTTNYQQSHAGGFTGYQNFWNPVRRVTVFDVFTTQSDMVDATIDYFFKDGRIIEERTSYRLITEDGLWKIDSSTVSNSQTR